MSSEKVMKKNFIIRSNDARLILGASNHFIPALKAIKGVKEKKDKKGNILVEAVPGIPETPAREASATVYLVGNDQEITNEIEARMADQGFQAEPETDKSKLFHLTYKAEHNKIIRAAFKKCKSKDGYNVAGLAALPKKQAYNKSRQIKPGEKTDKKPYIPEPYVRGDDDWKKEDKSAENPIMGGDKDSSNFDWD